MCITKKLVCAYEASPYCLTQWEEIARCSEASNDCRPAPPSEPEVFPCPHCFDPHGPQPDLMGEQVAAFFAKQKDWRLTVRDHKRALETAGLLRDNQDRRKQVREKADALEAAAAEALIRAKEAAEAKAKEATEPRQWEGERAKTPELPQLKQSPTRIPSPTWESLSSPRIRRRLVRVGKDRPRWRVP